MWFGEDCSFFRPIENTTESGGVRGIIDVIKEPEAKVVLSGCVGQKRL